MKRLFVAFAVLSLMGCNSTRSTDKLLAEVWRKDQDIRHQMIELTRAVSVDKRVELIDSLITITEEIERIDNQNMAIVDTLLQSALPKGLSSESYKTIWIVIDHASLEKQVQHLPLIEQMALEGLIERDNYATLFDRIAMKQNRSQRYGSQAVQFGSPDNMHLYIWPVEDAEKLDSLRATVGMGSMNDYIQQLTESTGVNAQYIPQITVEQINKMREIEQ